MLRKYIVFPIIMILSLVLVACSTVQALIPSAASATPTAPAGGRAFFGGPGGDTPLQLESKLSVGLLELESTPKRVTPDEAKLLLPLWQQVQALSMDANATNQQFQELYKQVEESLSADQVKAIEDMKISFANLQGLMTKYGVQLQGQFRRGPNSGATLSPAEQATLQAQFGGGQGGFQGNNPGRATLSPEEQATRRAQFGSGQGGFPGNNGNTLTPEEQATRRAQFANEPGGGRGMNMIDEAFIPPLLQLLETRASQ